jgi:hypothetical protein
MLACQQLWQLREKDGTSPAKMRRQIMDNSSEERHVVSILSVVLCEAAAYLVDLDVPESCEEGT